MKNGNVDIVIQDLEFLEKFCTYQEDTFIWYWKNDHSIRLHDTYIGKIIMGVNYKNIRFFTTPGGTKINYKFVKIFLDKETNPEYYL